MISKKAKYNRRKERTRYKIRQNGSDRVRLSFYTSNKYIYAQVVDEEKKQTITSLTTYSKIFSHLTNKRNVDAAKALGKEIAGVLLEMNLKNVYFDRGGRKYHGKTKAFAEVARENGLNF